jgi:hypothetical protein
MVSSWVGSTICHKYLTRLEVANTLAYNATVLVYIEISFITQDSWGRSHKTFWA